MNALSTFNFNTLAIRVVTIDGKPWFVAVDVYRALGLAQWGGILNPLDESEKIMRGRTSVGLGAGRDVWLITESGLYKLIMRSDKPQAKPFQDWVTRVVLPAIRKDGGYILGEENLKAPEDEDELVLRALEVLKRKVERLRAENGVMAKELNEVTVDEYRALLHAYWPHGFKVRMGQWASSLCRVKGIEVTKQTRTFTDTVGRTHETSLKVYPRAILDETYKELAYLLPVAA